MTEEEIKLLAQEIVNLKGGFYVEPEEHYQQHQRLDKMLSLYDSVGNVVLKFFIGAVIVGIFAAVALGLGWTK